MAAVTVVAAVTVLPGRNPPVQVLLGSNIPRTRCLVTKIQAK